APEHDRIRHAVAPPSYQQPSHDKQRSHLIELRRMYPHVGRRQPPRKGNCPRQVARPSVIVSDEKTSNAAYRVSDRKRGCGRRQGGYEWKPLPLHDHHGGADATDKSPEPAHASSTEEQIAKRLLPCVFRDPEQLRAQESSKHAGHRGVARRCGETAARQLAAEDPQTNERAGRDHHAERGDVKISDAEERRVHACANYQEKSVNRCIVASTAEVIIRALLSLIPCKRKKVFMARPRKILPSDLADLSKKTEILEREMTMQRAAIERLKQLGQVRAQPLRADDVADSSAMRRRMSR